MSNHRCAVFAVLAFVLLALALASASITGSISGVVTDKSGRTLVFNQAAFAGETAEEKTWSERHSTRVGIKRVIQQRILA